MTEIKAVLKILRLIHAQGFSEKLVFRINDAADLLEIHPHDAEERGIREGDRVDIESRTGRTVLPATLTERVQPGVVYTTFHFPESGANLITTENSDWATNCPEYKVTACLLYTSDAADE